MVLKRRLCAVGAVTATVAALITATTTTESAQAAPFTYQHFNTIQKRLASGLLAYELGSKGAQPYSLPGGGDEGDGPDGLPDTPPSGYAAAGGVTGGGNYYPSANGKCSLRRGSNVKVNQNCLNVSDPDLQGRGQANNETSIAVDTQNPQNLVASNNDYRRGDGTCGASYSEDGGATWNDATVPDGFSRGNSAPREYWQAGGDTSVAWDTRGNAYLSCQVFNRGTVASTNPDESSGFLVFRSTGNGGASFNFPGRNVRVSFDPNGTGAAPFEDKQLLTVDNNVHSPYRDRVYVSWTEFAADGTAYIYEAYSSNYAQRFSKPVLVSRNSGICTQTFGVPTPKGSCNENQFSDPFVGPDGSLYVTWANFNNTPTGNDNRNQMMLAKSSDGGQSFGKPTRVGWYYDLPDCQASQGDDAGRACVPEKGTSTRSVFRATNYPSGSVDPTDPTRVAITYGSYINRNSNEANGCVPNGFSAFGQDVYLGVKTPGACNNDILVSVSTNAGASFTGGNFNPRIMRTVNQDAAQTTSDQFWQWSAFSDEGRLVVGYMDRQYGADEHNGSSDVSLSTSRNLTSFATTRVTTSSMPPPTQFYGTKGGLFYGDYNGLAVAAGSAYPIWSDTRGTDVFRCPGTATGPGNPPQLCTGIESNGQTANDEDISTARMALPGSG